MKRIILLIAGIVGVTSVLAQPTIDSVTFIAPDTVVAWVVPPGNDSITAEVFGAPGGRYTSVSTGTILGTTGRGFGRKVRIDVNPGDTLFLFIGGTGYTGLATGRGAFNGGGKNSANSFGTAGGGGGASDIRKGGKSLADRIVVAGGGGGASYNESTTSVMDYAGGNAGIGDGVSGLPSGSNNGGGGGTSSSTGGSGGTRLSFNSGTAGTFGQGGNGGAGACGGGGGGGYYGGGGGSFGGGGGGNSRTTFSIDGPGVNGLGFFINSGLAYISIKYIKNGVGIASVSSFFKNAAIHPNPSSNSAVLSLTLAKTTNVQVQLYDLMGKVVWSQVKNLASGLNDIALPAVEIPAGSYLVRLKAEGQERDYTIKWIKE